MPGTGNDDPSPHLLTIQALVYQAAYKGRQQSDGAELLYLGISMQCANSAFAHVQCIQDVPVLKVLTYITGDGLVLVCAA
jgi:hypothetical protein